MKKRFICLVMVFAIVCSLTAIALAAPRAAVAAGGGLLRSGSNYVLWGTATGGMETKTIVATLYRQVGSKWEYYDSVSNTGSSMQVEASKTLSITSGYQYKVEAVATSPTSRSPYTVYYDFT